jgi:ATP-dependent phosphofructokinase / diphosphate-dependent phosphofructokinase
MTKKIGILTSGGDCPGLNAVIRGVLKCATEKNWEVYGIPYGTDGFIHLAKGKYKPEQFKLEKHGYDLSQFLKVDVLQFMSGSILGSISKGEPNKKEVREAILKGYELLGLDALIAVGGDGSLHIIYDLAKEGNWNFIAIPKTIDNDVPFTQQSVGFDTACNIVTECLYDLTFTAASHDRVMIAQVMGRDAGHLALNAGITGGADIILIPEITPHLTENIVDKCCRKISQLRHEGRQFALVVIAEGVKNHAEQKEKYIGDYLANWIKEHSKKCCDDGSQIFCELQNIDARVTVLGHLQRSGTPSFFDRILAAVFAVKAIELIDQGIYSQLVIWKDGNVDHIALDDVMNLVKRCHDFNECASAVKSDNIMLKTAKELGIYVGD